MTDLHCPARLTLAALPEGLEPESLRPAAVYASAGGAALAARLVERYDVLDAPLPGALDDVADRHRGEDVWVLLTEAELASVHEPAVPGAPVRVEIDADGWAFRQ
jgi:hypothetical protein